VFARTFPYFLPLKRIIPAVHLAVYRATNGRISSKLAGQHMLLLTAKGRRTGKRRVVPLLYVPDGDDMIVIGSNWGGQHDPAWVANVLSDTKPRVQAYSQKLRVAAHLAQGDQRSRAWQLVTAQYPGYKAYATRLDGVREIPLVILTPVRT
jgi:deazaflavin-dependent oxidoreductase (nitroreductase family)